MDGQPVDVVRCAGADRSEHQTPNPFRVTLGVGRPKDRSPRDPEHDPPLDAEVLSKPLDVSDMMIHVDGLPMHAVLAGVRGAPPRRPLIEQHRSMPLRIEERPSSGRAARPWSAVQVHDRRGFGVADLLVVEDVPVADVEPARCTRFGSLLSHPHPRHAPVELQ